MNVDDLQWQLSHLGGVLPRIVDEILERGGLEVLVEAAREREDWFCAVGAARGLCAVGDFGRAWTVMAPFAVSGWQPAVRAGADVLLRWNRVEQALELAHPDRRGQDSCDAWRDYAEALVRAGRVDEAIGVLVPFLRDRRVLRGLVEMTDGQGCDERVLEVVTPIAEEFRRDPTQGSVGDLWEVLPAQARVLERSGRADEAIRLLGTDVAARRYGPQNNIDFYAELLARHGRVEELRDLATGTQKSSAAGPYVKALENLGRAGEAEAYLRDLIAAKHPGWYENALMELLIRQGRFDDAIEAVKHTFDDLYDRNLLQAAMILLAEQGQHDKAIELTEGRSPEFLAENEAFWLRSNRWWLMGEAGRAREAIEEIEALPAGEVDDRELTIAWLLAQDSRVEQAIARLRPLPGKRAATDLAALLIRQTRFTEAVAVIPDVAAQREEERRFWTDRTEQKEMAPSDSGDEWGDPWTAPNTAHLE
ncbi:tetratricopeptide repeat protein [Streptomyces mirabilis]|uniref:tetratricopeptide repeat protein n=1 Tax=Streptomyces mirabilis TaxID=68239 RepID=UPI0036E9649A